METIFFVQDLKLSKKELRIGVGEEVTLQAVVEPEEACQRKIQWKSDDTNVINVTENGVITAFSVGTATIFAKSDYGFDHCTVIVEKGTQKIWIPNYCDVILNDRFVQIPVRLARGNGELSFVSENKDLIAVSDNGRMNLKNIGEAKIKIIAKETELYVASESVLTVNIKKLGLESPVFQKVSNKPMGIMIKWSRAANAAGYYIYRREENDEIKKIAVVESGNALQYLDERVESGFKYTYFVRAYNDTQISGNRPNKKTLVFLTRPEWEEVSSGNGRIHLKWKLVNGAQGYYVYRNAGDNEWIGLANVEGEENTEFVDRFVKSGEAYSYIIRAYNGDTVSSYDAKSESLVYLDMPELNSVNNIDGAVRLIWDQVGGATGYYVYRKKNNENWKVIADVAEGNILACEDTDVESGEIYKYTVRAYRGNILSTYDPVGKSILCLSVPEINSISNGNGYINIRWSQTRGAGGYYVYRKNGNESWNLIATVTGEMTIGYNDVSVQSGEFYHYTVRAYRGRELSSYSDEGADITCLDMPKLGELAREQECIHVSWESVCGAAGYYVYRKEENTKWNRIAAINLEDVTYYTDRNFKNNMTYIYTVRAYRDSVLSAFDADGKCIIVDKDE